MGSALSRWWAPFLPGPERTSCEGALSEEEGSSCRQLNRCSVGSPLDTVITCLLKAGQWGLSLAEEFHSTRQHARTHTHTHAHTGTCTALQPRLLLLRWERKWILVKQEVKEGCHKKKKLVYRFEFWVDDMNWSVCPCRNASITLRRSLLELESNRAVCEALTVGVFTLQMFICQTDYTLEVTPALLKEIKRISERDSLLVRSLHRGSLLWLGETSNDYTVQVYKCSGYQDHVLCFWFQQFQVFQTWNAVFIGVWLIICFAVLSVRWIYENFTHGANK